MAGLKCLITGGSGFIGSLLARSLEGDYEVVIVDRNTPKMKFSKATKVIISDFQDTRPFDAELSQADFVLHLACSSVPLTSFEDPLSDLQANITGSVKLLQRCVEHKVKNFIFLSSGGTVYGIAKKRLISESHPTNPLSFHGAMKLAIEKYILAFHHSYKLNYLIFRPSNAYGKGYAFGRPQGAVPIFLKNVLKGEPVIIWGDGSCIRDYLWAEDLIAAIVIALKKRLSNRIYNISSGQGTSLLRLVRLIEEITGSKARISFRKARPIDVPYNVLDSSLARRDLCWNPKVSLKQGLARLLADYQEKTAMC